jgi:hypothetical protein
VSHQFRAGLGLLILGAGAVFAGDLPCVQASHECLPLNPDVRQDSIKQTICALGYTKTIRPPWSYTNGIKASLLRERGLGERMADFELDHRVPLSLGGHPWRLGNLTLQPWAEANRKDLLERRLQILVCRGQLKLTEAQACIAENWERCAAEHK